MPVDFQFDRLRIERFRGILDFELPFSRGVPTYLIGGNNTGKSTLLDAFALALRGGGFHAYDIEDFDFHRNRSDGQVADEFVITVHFKATRAEDLPAVQGVGDPVPVHGVRAVGKRSGSDFELRTHLLDHQGARILLSPRTPLKAEAKKKYKGRGLGWGSYYARLDEIRTLLPEVWLLRPDNIEASLYHWKSGPLKRLAKMLSDKFVDTAWTFAHEGQQQAMPVTLERAHQLLKASVQSFPFWRDELKPKIESAFSKYLGQAAMFGLAPDVQSLREWLTQQLAVSFAADVGAPLMPLTSNGDGWQALARLATLEVLQALNPRPAPTSVLVLFEEPETYLHPHLRRKLRDVLEALAAGGWMVLVSTHAPEFVSFRKPQQIIRLWPSSPIPTHGRLLTSGLPEEIRFQERLDERGNHELLFANRVVLCEGQDDRSALSTYFEKALVDVDGFGVTLLDLGSVYNMPLYAKMAGDLKIPWCALTDEDRSADGTLNTKTEDVRVKVRKLATSSDLLPMWPGSLEQALKASDVSPKWQQINLLPKSLEQIKLDYPDFVHVAETIARWIDGRSP